MRPQLFTVILMTVSAHTHAEAQSADSPPRTHFASTGAFRCDGTDPFFFEELNAAGTLGYGETWDSNLCNEGTEVYAEGASGRWKAFRTPRRAKVTAEQQAVALVLPAVVFGGLFAVALAAFAIAFVQRLKRSPIVEVACGACAASLPIEANAGPVQHLFCPMCGAPCTVQVTGKGKSATAVAT